MGVPFFAAWPTMFQVNKASFFSDYLSTWLFYQKRQNAK
ncbi:hypothetical protein MuYL_1305 [Mucilaginibacter xinganensis]|uniref:Uncharacterized protein n=1 Tax=Mucilaginibacter xinganensis TaxID=1234841 RepID=A0A223NTL4_9SPHI|nr:hypothetical protein MuYL_1305 [Mucilaginibacter xinganensis]